MLWRKLLFSPGFSFTRVIRNTEIRLIHGFRSKRLIVSTIQRPDWGSSVKKKKPLANRLRKALVVWNTPLRIPPVSLYRSNGFFSPNSCNRDLIFCFFFIKKKEKNMAAEQTIHYIPPQNSKRKTEFIFCSSTDLWPDPWKAVHDYHAQKNPSQHWWRVFAINRKNKSTPTPVTQTSLF